MRKFLFKSEVIFAFTGSPLSSVVLEVGLQNGQESKTIQET